MYLRYISRSFYALPKVSLADDWIVKIRKILDFPTFHRSKYPLSSEQSAYLSNKIGCLLLIADFCFLKNGLYPIIFRQNDRYHILIIQLTAIHAANNLQP